MRSFGKIIIFLLQRFILFLSRFRHFLWWIQQSNFLLALAVILPCWFMAIQNSHGLLFCLSLVLRIDLFRLYLLCLHITFELLKVRFCLDIISRINFSQSILLLIHHINRNKGSWHLLTTTNAIRLIRFILHRLLREEIKGFCLILLSSNFLRQLRKTSPFICLFFVETQWWARHLVFLSTSSVRP